jgi:hypothetical protein
VLVVSGNLETGSLTRTAAFPVLITNALDWLADSGASAKPAEAGEAAAPAEPAGGQASDLEEALADLPGTGPWRVRESDLRVPADLGTAAAAVDAAPPGPPLWLYLAGAAVLLAALEWCLYQRRWIS